MRSPNFSKTQGIKTNFGQKKGAAQLFENLFQKTFY